MGSAEGIVLLGIFFQQPPVPDTLRSGYLWWSGVRDRDHAVLAAMLLQRLERRHDHLSGRERDPGRCGLHPPRRQVVAGMSAAELLPVPANANTTTRKLRLAVW